MDWPMFAAGFFTMLAITIYDLHLFQKALDSIDVSGNETLEQIEASLARLRGAEFKARKRFLGSIRWEHGL